MNPHEHDHAGRNDHGDHHDPPARHGMAVLGTDAVYLSHLPMFMDVHDYQVLLEAEFTGPDGHPHPGYANDRRQHPDVLYTLKPERFVLPEILPGNGAPARSSFRGEVFRHHYERTTPPALTPVSVADALTVTVRRIVHARQFEQNAERPPQLEYILFGKGDELFLAHRINTPPDFDHLLQVRLDVELGDGDLAGGPRVVVPDRADLATERIHAGGGTVSAVLHAGNREIKISIDPVREFYFEEAELAEDHR
jgi:hypothetical protein